MPKFPTISAACLAIVLAALMCVGVVSGTLIPHVIQVAPIAVAIAAVWVRPQWAAGAAAAIFAFWLLIMTFIWLFLLGWARITTGHFSPAEIVLTIVIGAASVVGLAMAAINWRSESLWKQLLLALLFFSLQVAAMWLSLQSQFATS